MVELNFLQGFIPLLLNTLSDIHNLRFIDIKKNFIKNYIVLFFQNNQKINKIRFNNKSLMNEKYLEKILYVLKKFKNNDNSSLIMIILLYYRYVLLIY